MPTGLGFNFKDYLVDDIRFRMSPDFDFHAARRVLIEPVFTRTVVPVDADLARVQLAVAIHAGQTPLPFDLDATVSIAIAAPSWAEPPARKTFLVDNAAILLYPYLRALVASVTGSTTYPSYSPPFLNIVAYLNEQERKTVKV